MKVNFPAGGALRLSNFLQSPMLPGCRLV